MGLGLTGNLKITITSHYILPSISVCAGWVLNILIKQQESASSPVTNDYLSGQYCCSNWHPDAVMKLYEALLKEWTVTGNSQQKFKGKYQFATHENDQRLHTELCPLGLGAGLRFPLLFQSQDVNFIYLQPPQIHRVTGL